MLTHEFDRQSNHALIWHILIISDHIYVGKFGINSNVKYFPFFITKYLGELGPRGSPEPG